MTKIKCMSCGEKFDKDFTTEIVPGITTCVQCAIEYRIATSTPSGGWESPEQQVRDTLSNFQNVPSVFPLFPVWFKSLTDEQKAQVKRAYQTGVWLAPYFEKVLQPSFLSRIFRRERGGAA